MTHGYESNYQCIHDHLQYINLVLAKAILAKEESTKGSCISQEEVWQVIDNIEKFSECDNTQVVSSINEAKSIIDANVNFSLQNTVDVPFLKLYSVFKLNDDEIFIVLILLAKYINPKYKIIFAYLNGNATQNFPTIHLILDILCTTNEERFYKGRYFHNSAPLISHHIVEMEEETLSLNDRIKDWLREINSVESNIENFIEIHQSSDQKMYFKNVAKISFDTREVTWLKGRKSCEKIRWIHCYHRNNKEIIISSLKEILTNKDFCTILNFIFREALLRNACIFFLDGSILNEKVQRNMVLRFIHGKLKKEKHYVYICNKNGCQRDFNNQSYYVSTPKYNERFQIWKSFFEKKLPPNKIKNLAQKYLFSFSQIEQCFREWSRNSRPINETCDKLSVSQESHNVQHLAPHYEWKDIVLSIDKKQQLKEISHCIENSEFVLRKWNFQSKMVEKCGISIIFSGPPGTGKTMAADILAGSNDMDLYKVDAISIVGKSIEETEKKLRKIFEEIPDSRSILFFDEVDSLFVNNHERDSVQDCYTNAVIGCLQQKIENYAGVVILATNLLEHLDKRFVRRMNFIIQFPYPELKQRIRIWKKIFPKEIPIQDIDFEFLANKIDLSGRYIKNIAWLACFYAAQEDKVLRMPHIIQSVRREYQKIGKTFLDSDFAPYI